MLSSAKLLHRNTGPAADMQKFAVAAMGVRTTLYLITFSAEETAEEISAVQTATIKGTKCSE